ncbi:MAG: biopolymer transporter ExbD [Bacteroidota bacterium]
MPKVKIPRKNTAIDMAPMCDVAFLLLTFFMLTSNFTSKEAVQVSTPSSISEIKIPEVNIMNILVDKDGKVFFGIDGQEKRKALLEAIATEYKLTFTKEELHTFSTIASFGVPTNALKTYLDLPGELRDSKQNALGIPSDSTNNELKSWIKFARNVNPDLKIAIKADKGTTYPKIKSVMNTLQDLRENRYNLITNLEEPPKGL